MVSVNFLAFIIIIFLFPGYSISQQTVNTTTTQSGVTEEKDGSKTNLSLTISLNMSVTLNCTTNDGPGAVIWWFNSSILYSGSESFSGFSNVRLNNNKSQLVINGFQVSNVGLYACAHGRNKESFFYLNLEEPFEKTVFLLCENDTCPRFLSVTEQTQVTFQCFTNLPHQQKYVWLLNNISVNENDFKKQMPSADFHVAEFGKGSVLYLNITQRVESVTCVWEDLFRTVLLQVTRKKEESSPIERKHFELLSIVIVASCAFVACICAVRKMRSSPCTNANNAQHVITDQGNTYNDHNVDEQPQYQFFAEPLDNGNAVDCPFEANVKDFGLRMYSFRSRDSVSEFWDARLGGGHFKKPFVTRYIRDKASSDERKDFLKFQNALQQMSTHTNILKAIGFRKDTFPYRIYYEFYEDVTLGNVLQQKKGTLKQQVSTIDLLEFAENIANGMIFLKLRGFDHVALRTEKVLLFNGWKCKLFDFNLSSQSEGISIRMLQNNEALGWLGPEVICLETYNKMTDIWAFGVLLWELWSDGHIPYQGINREGIKANMKRNRYLARPRKCPESIYNIILSCWKNQSSERQNFLEIRTKLSQLINNPKSINDGSNLYCSRFYEAIDKCDDGKNVPGVMKEART